jgi:hypothetical protein
MNFIIKKNLGLANLVNHYVEVLLLSDTVEWRFFTRRSLLSYYTSKNEKIRYYNIY